VLGVPNQYFPLDRRCGISSAFIVFGENLSGMKLFFDDCYDFLGKKYRNIFEI